MGVAIGGDARNRLRELVAERFGLRASALPDARVDDALAQLSADDARPPVEALAALAALPANRPGWQRVIGILVVGETSFFRHQAWFAQLEERILGPLIAAAQRSGRKRLRIWSAGCATGEEPYGIAIAVKRLLVGLDGWDVRIVGTDVNAGFLDAARAARYRPWSLREVDPIVRGQYFEPVEQGRFELASAIRQLVTFAPYNLVENVPVHPHVVRADVDLVICRNVLMYLTPAQQRTVAARLSSYLASGGWLAVAPLEASAELFPALTVLNVPSAIFFQRSAKVKR